MKKRIFMTAWILLSVVGTVIPVVLIIRAIQQDRRTERFIYPRGR